MILDLRQVFSRILRWGEDEGVHLHSNYNLMEAYFKFVNSKLDEGWKMTSTSCDEEGCRVAFFDLGNALGPSRKEENCLHQV